MTGSIIRSVELVSGLISRKYEVGNCVRDRVIKVIVDETDENYGMPTYGCYENYICDANNLEDMYVAGIIATIRGDNLVIEYDDVNNFAE